MKRHDALKTALMSLLLLGASGYANAQEVKVGVVLTYTGIGAEFAQLIDRGMEQYLRSLNFPSRTDIVNLAERVAMLEQKIDAIAMSLGATEGTLPSTAMEDAPVKRKRKKKANGGRPSTG